MWIMIIIFTTWGGSSGVSITSVPGFKSETLCLAARAKAETELPGMTTTLRAICVKGE